MSRIRYTAVATAAGLLAIAAPAMAVAAKPKLMPQASESVAPTAAGKKPYQASAPGTCAASSCQVKFGKKAGKIRRITDVSCLLLSSTGVALGALIRVDDRQISYIPLTSRAVVGTGEYASGALPIKFDLLGGEQLTIELASSDTASASNCVVNGTIE